MPSKIFPILLSGGAGSRLWPLSRESYPKQLIPLTGKWTLLQQTALRVMNPGLFEPMTVITGERHRFLVAEQLREIDVPSPTIVLEPCQRNTAAAGAIAGLLASQIRSDALLLIMPTDHCIENLPGFVSALAAGAEAAQSGAIVLFGVQPIHPATGYGYIHAGSALPGSSRVRRVERFVEKPDHETAERYVSSGAYLWNSGIFLVSARSLIDELSKYGAEILEHAREALARSVRDADFLRLDSQAFDSCPSKSLDHAVMERTERAAVVAADFGWSDVGSWSTLWNIAERDESGNAILGEAVTEHTRNSYIRSEGPLIATVGVEDLIVVATRDAVLVAPKDHDQDIANIVKRMRTHNIAYT